MKVEKDINSAIESNDSDDGLTDNFDECFNKQKFQSHLDLMESRKRAMQESDVDSQTEETIVGQDELPIPVYPIENRLKFDQEWNTDPEMNSWLIEKPNNTAFCVHCKCYLRIGSGKKDLLKHVKTAKHQRNINSPIEEDAEQRFEDEHNESSKFFINVFYLFPLNTYYLQKKFIQEVENLIRFGKMTQNSRIGL